MTEIIATTDDGSELVLGDGSTLVLNVEPTPTNEWPFCPYWFSRPRIKPVVREYFVKSAWEEFYICCDMGLACGIFGPDEMVDSGELVAVDSSGVDALSDIIALESVAYDGKTKFAVKIKKPDINIRLL